MMKFSFGALLFSLSISFPFAAASGGAGTEDLPDKSVYAKGCLPDPYYQPHAVPYREDPLPGSLSSGSIRGFDVPRPLPPSSMLESITPARDQGSLGACTAFAVVAALECLVPGVSFSEAELYIRAKTKGGSPQTEDECYLSTYIPLVQEGAVEARYFVEYERYLYRVGNAKMRLAFEEAYMKITTKQSHGHEELSLEDKAALLPHQKVVLTGSLDYRASIEALRPRDGHIKPIWKEERYEASIAMPDSSDVVLGKALCYVNPLYWGARLVSAQPGLRFERMETRVRTVIDPDSYHPQKFHMEPIKAILSDLKAALRDKKPLVVSVMTFVEKDREDNVITDYWGADYLGPKGWVIDFPVTETKVEDDGHAVCLCGYDDTKRAFRLKNSWNPTRWGEKGFAWITYDYILNKDANAEIYVIKKR